MSMSDQLDSRSSSSRSSTTELPNFPDIEDVHRTSHDEIRVDIPPEIDSRCIYGVPPHLHAKRKQVYDPVVISIGPYHHGHPRLSQMEKFKEMQLENFILWSQLKDPKKGKDFFFGKIMENIDSIRKNYEEVKYNDTELAEIILRDACYLTSLLEESSHESSLSTCELFGGITTIALLSRDLYMLENQIPFWIIKHLVYLSSGEDKADKLAYEFLVKEMYSHCPDPTIPPWKHDNATSPLHFLEAYQKILLEPVAVNKATTTTTRNSSPKTPKATNGATRCKEIFFKCKNIWKTKIRKTKSENISYQEISEDWKNLPSRSVTYLQAKGIHFRPSSKSLQNITFTQYHFYGMLYLPILYIDSDTHVLFSNIIAFEMSSAKYFHEGCMLSYVNLMKSLIHTSKDAQELRERDILHSTLMNEKVIEIFKDIPTYGLEMADNYANTKRAINKHCHSKSKTWMADLSHTYCRNPWAAIAIFATTFVLVLTFLQTYYTIHPVG